MSGDDVADRYAGAGRGWAGGAAHVYGPIARDLVGLLAARAGRLEGTRVLDAGAGTGLVSDALAVHGARPLALDVSPDMLAQAPAHPRVVGSVTAVPLRDGVVDAVVAAFVLNHVTDPVRGLRELARVTRGGGTVVAAVYDNANASAVRDRIDVVTAAHGFSAPGWYRRLKTEAAPLLGSVERMTDAATAAGLADVVVDAVAADVGVERASQLVDYRLGQAHVAAWLGGLDPARRAAVREEAVAAVAPVMEPYRPGVVRLVATVR